MMLNDAICNASSEHTVYFLLTAYIDSLQFSGKPPGYVTALPLVGLEDLESRLGRLLAECGADIRWPESPRFIALLEVINIFEAAVTRLRRLADDGGIQRAIIGSNAYYFSVADAEAA